jgi:hypothetical protein
LAKIEADEEIIIARPSCVRRENDIDVLIAETRAQRAGRQPTTQDEIRAWRAKASGSAASTSAVTALWLFRPWRCLHAAGIVTERGV